MKMDSAAPRLRASMPTAPVPENTSTKREPAMAGPRMLKSVSRRRSLVGRSASPFRLFKMRLRYFPAIMRMRRDSRDEMKEKERKRFYAEATETQSSQRRAARLRWLPVGAQHAAPLQRRRINPGAFLSRSSPGGSGVAIVAEEDAGRAVGLWLGLRRRLGRRLLCGLA